jgi:hypothetical protein
VKCVLASDWGTSFLFIPLMPCLVLISYFYTFLFPSAALMPMEYCLPMMDVVEEPDFAVTYRQFVQDRTGVKLIIEL